MSVYSWEHADVKCKLPKYAFQGGVTASGEDIYVGRAMFNGCLMPAKIVPSQASCSVTHDGVECFVETFEYLTGKEKYFEWRPAADGNISTGAIATGSLGPEQLFIGRASYKSSMSIGKIHPSQNCLFVPHEGKEVALTSYEVLVWTKSEKESEKYEEKRRKTKKKKKRKMKLDLSSSDSNSDWSDCSIC